MSFASFARRLPFVFLLTGCQVASGQYPYGLNYSGVISGGPPSSPQSVTQRQIQTGPKRGQYALEKALEGMLMGGAFGGIYGAGGGLILGFLTGLFTADAHHGQLNTQIQTEQTKDKLLEAKIEQELERQRQLEAQRLTGAPDPTLQNHASTQQRNRPTASSVAMKDASNTVASLSKKESSSNPRRSPFKNVEVRDMNGDGIPDMWIYYSPTKSGEVVRQEEASQFDGRVDTWSYFKDGKLVRREVDTQGTGAADTFYYYEKEKMVREERDLNGTGHVSFRAFYQNGRRARVEEDTHERGQTDRWIYFDTSKDGEIVLKEERDLNRDGTIDVWSYYEDGRLVRRDLSAAGLELVKNDQIPSAVNSKQTPRAR